MNSSILGQEQNRFLSPYTLSTLATGGQNLFDLKKFDRVIIIALTEHVKKFTSRQTLVKLFKKNISKKVELIELNKETSCQAETVLNGILKAKLKGGIFIKDVDNIFSGWASIPPFESH